MSSVFDLHCAVVYKDILKLLYESYGDYEKQKPLLSLLVVLVQYHCKKKLNNLLTLTSTESHSYSFLSEDVLADITSQLDFIRLTN